MWGRCVSSTVAVATQRFFIAVQDKINMQWQGRKLNKGTRRYEHTGTRPILPRVTIISAKTSPNKTCPRPTSCAWTHVCCASRFKTKMTYLVMSISTRSNKLQLFLCKGTFKSRPHYSSHSSFLTPFFLLRQLTLWAQTCKYNSLYSFDLDGLDLTSEKPDQTANRELIFSTAPSLCHLFGLSTWQLATTCTWHKKKN